MRLRNPKNKDEILNNSKLLIKEKEKLNLKEIFKKDQPVYLEIGMGKGDFLKQIAENNPDNNYIGIEKFDGVICKAIKKLEELDLPNIRLLRCDASLLADYFDHNIEAIYLNFSDPWPKKRHHKKRLTHENMLKVYDNIFKGKKKIYFKTDNVELFNDSLEYFKEYGYEIKYITRDLHSENRINYETEYEKKFSDLGYKINYVEVEKND